LNFACYLLDNQPKAIAVGIIETSGSFQVPVIWLVALNPGAIRANCKYTCFVAFSTHFIASHV